MADDPIADAIAGLLAKPLKISGDAGSVEQHSLADLIAAHKYLAGLSGGVGTRRGLRFSRLIPDGTVHHRGCSRFRD